MILGAQKEGSDLIIRPSQRLSRAQLIGIVGRIAHVVFKVETAGRIVPAQLLAALEESHSGQIRLTPAEGTMKALSLLAGR